MLFTGSLETSDGAMDGNATTIQIRGFSSNITEGSIVEIYIPMLTVCETFEY